jgi:N-acyl-D-amino-acid deacylase
VATAFSSGSQPVYDIVIRGGIVLDGTGAKGIRADVGIVEDRIETVGDLAEAETGRVLNATGLRVAPGFIDIHTHSDISATYAPDQASAIAMGVTMQVTGNCALSLGFATDSDVFAFERRILAPHKARIFWKTFDEHLRAVEENGIATNFLQLAGHGTLRKRIMGMEERAADTADMAAMRRELDAALAAGAWGLSSGLEYTPSSYADEDELTALCEVVAAHGGFYATHLRSEGDYLIEAVQEALNVAERAALPLQLSHHKAEGRANWGKVQRTLNMVEAARARGLDVQLDQYPYTAFMTGLAVQTLPRWVLSGSSEETSARLTDPAQRAAIVAEIRIAHPDWDDLSDDSPWHNVQIGVCRGRREIQGRSIAALAKEAARNPIEYVLDLIAETGGYVSAVNFSIGEADIAEVMRYPWTAIGSDGVGTHPKGPAGGDRIHPRAYGTFPRVLGRYVRELGVLTEAQAIHKMTGLPAARLGLTDRGLLAPGFHADITIYAPETVGDRATFDAPHRFAAGIAFVIINGRIAYENSAPNGTLAGRVLRRAG